MKSTDNQGVTGDGYDEPYRHVRTGFKLFLYSILIFVGYAFFLSAVAAVLAVLSIDSTSWGVSWLTYVAGSILVTCLLCTHAGTLLWLRAPRTPERRLCILLHGITLTCVLGGVVQGFIFDFAPAFIHKYPFVQYATGLLLGVTQVWAFINFCELTAMNSQSPRFLQSSKDCQFYFPIVTGASVLGATFAMAFPNSEFLLLIAIACGLLCLFLVINLLLAAQYATEELKGSSRINVRSLAESIAGAGILLGTGLSFLFGVQ